ncbi:copper-binding protein [Azospirillum sp. B21]|uniref:cupredoxin domain-containing protein n=1 Tax=unclassified Azospirillum TaxID=2630922 RepID=UPI0011EC2D48|nr:MULTISPECIES: plastocyanin/azurin family copper-binding protein [unclassified Azospirillum]KAA0576136.1 copper-binding protein [Azospirillum sp. B21]MDR6774770.1 putative cupredoxin-like copper-binding protein [Azospirillum sp. BE72]
MRLHTRTLNTAAALLTGATFLSLIGTAFAGAGEPGHGHTTAAIGEPAKASAAKRTIQVELGDNYYKPESVQVKAGETVRFVLKNKGEFLHEFNIGTADMHAAHQKEMAMMMEHGMLTATGINKNMSGMDHSKMGMAEMKHDDPNSALVGPGETKELTWKFTKDTALEFACNMPGHYESGMVGKIAFTR